MLTSEPPKRGLTQRKKAFENNVGEHFLLFQNPHLGGSVVSVSDSWPGGSEFDNRLRQTFFLAYFAPHLRSMWEK